VNTGRRQPQLYIRAGRIGHVGRFQLRRPSRSGPVSKSVFRDPGRIFSIVALRPVNAGANYTVAGGDGIRLSVNLAQEPKAIFTLWRDGGLRTP